LMSSRRRVAPRALPWTVEANAPAARSRLCARAAQERRRWRRRPRRAGAPTGHRSGQR
jgi:hypothetical protein